MSKPATLLAFDQASLQTGYAAFDGTDLMKWDLIKLPKSVPSQQRIVEMSHQIEVVIQKYRPRLVVFEDVQIQHNAQAALVLARLQGLLIGLCDRYHIAYEILSPTTWRRYLGFQQGRGVSREQLKEQAVTFVRNGYGVVVGEDICEAICIGLAHLNNLGLLPSLDDLRRSGRRSDCKENQDGKDHEKHADEAAEEAGEE